MSDSPDVDRRRFCGAAAVTVAAGSLGLLGISQRVSHMNASRRGHRSRRLLTAA